MGILKDLAAAAFLSGGATIASQGRIKWVPICVGDVVTLPNGNKGFAITQIDSPRVIFSEGEVQWLQVGPGFTDRVPEFYCPYNWHVAVQKFGFEERAYNLPGLTNLGIGRVASQPSILNSDVAQWIVSDGGPATLPTSSLAQRIATRQSTLLGAGVMLWRFKSTYAYPELELGDTVAVPTDRFTAMNPISGTGIVGRYWANAVIVETNPDARTFGVWVRQWSDMAPSRQTVSNTTPTGTTTLSSERFVGTIWNRSADTYARPLTTGVAQGALATLTEVELPTGAKLQGVAMHVYVDTQSAGGASIGCVLYKVPKSGTPSRSGVFAAFIADTTNTALGTWTTPELVVNEVVDWTAYHYFVNVDLRGDGTIDNCRFGWVRLSF